MAADAGDCYIGVFVPNNDLGDFDLATVSTRLEDNGLGPRSMFLRSVFSILLRKWAQLNRYARDDWESERKIDKNQA